MDQACVIDCGMAPFDFRKLTMALSNELAKFVWLNVISTQDTAIREVQICQVNNKVVRSDEVI